MEYESVFEFLDLHLIYIPIAAYTVLTFGSVWLGSCVAGVADHRLRKAVAAALVIILIVGTFEALACLALYTLELAAGPDSGLMLPLITLVVALVLVIPLGILRLIYRKWHEVLIIWLFVEISQVVFNLAAVVY